MKNRKRSTINLALAHQNRIKFHTQTHVTAHISQPLTDFLAFVKNILPDDKFKIFKTLFRYPVITNEVTGVVFNKLSRIFDGRNPAINYQFMNSEQRDDWEYYRQDVLHEPNVWQTKGWDFFKTEINSILIVDLPVEQSETDKYPQPYFYWLKIDDVISYEADPTTGVMSWIIFKQRDDKIAVIDDKSYRIFTKKNNNIDQLIVESPHFIGYCPARFFWNVPLSIEQPDVKESPITNELEALDWYLFFSISKRHLDLYGSYPIYSGYEQSCDYSNEENGDTCDGGFLKNKNGYYKLDSAGMLIPCPKCGNKKIAGAGSYVQIPIPDEDQPDLRNPVQMLTVDTASLDYNVNEQKRLRENIITSCVGKSDDSLLNREAINQQQVEASFESQSTILNRVKKGFEEAQQFVDETICRLRYGNMFVSAKINLGTDFYIDSPETLRQRYKLAKDSGSSEAELDALQDQIIATEYRNNPTQLQRMLILSELEPYRHLTVNEVVNLYEKQIISDEDMRIKLNFTNFVKRFERENTNVLEFGSAKPFAEKIKIIQQEFKKYANENLNIKEV